MKILVYVPPSWQSIRGIFYNILLMSVNRKSNISIIRPKKWVIWFSFATLISNWDHVYVSGRCFAVLRWDNANVWYRSSAYQKLFQNLLVPIRVSNPGYNKNHRQEDLTREFRNPKFFGGTWQAMCILTKEFQSPPKHICLNLMEWALPRVGKRAFLFNLETLISSANVLLSL
jgi:hypothetical protein